MVNRNLIRHLTGQFATLPDAAFEALCGSVEVVYYDRRLRITNIGEIENNVYLVAKGLLRQFYYMGKEEVTTALTKEQGVTCAFLSFFSGKESAHIIETLEPSTLYVLNKPTIEELCKMHVSLENIYRKIVSDALLNSEVRTMERLITSPIDRFIKFMTQQGDLQMRVPQNYLASYLNIRPETFSRFKRLMKEKKKQMIAMPAKL